MRRFEDFLAGVILMAIGLGVVTLFLCAVVMAVATTIESLREMGWLS